MFASYFLFAYLCLGALHHTDAYHNDESRLHEYLFVNKSYSPLLRPVLNSSSVITVQLRLGIKSVFYVDEMHHKVTVSAILYKNWTDEILQWLPKDFGGIEYTYVHFSKIWTPQIQLVSKYSNENNEALNIREVYDDYPVKIWYDGNVEFIPSVHLTSNCLFSYINFPMDVQRCTFMFQMPYSKQVILKMDKLVAMVDDNSPKSLWSIVDMQYRAASDPYGNTVNSLILSMKRRMRYYLFTTPSYVIYIMSMVMFLLPQTSSQRLIIGASCFVMTTMLTYMMSNNLPHNDIVAWPLVGKLYLFNSVLLAFSLVFSAFIINVSQGNHLKSVPNWLKKLTVNVLAKIFCLQSLVMTVFNSFDQKVYEEEMTLQSGIYESSNVDSETSSEEHPKTPLKEVLKKIYEHLQQIHDTYQKKTFKEKHNNEWLLVASLVDRMLFIAYCFVIVLSVFSILKNN